MGFNKWTSSDEGMRFNVSRSDIHKSIALKWLTDDHDPMVQSNGDQGYIATWYWHGENAEQHLEEKLGEIALVCDGYTVHNYRSSGDGINKWESTSTACICRPETEEADR